MIKINNIKELKFYEDFNGYRIEIISSIGYKYIYFFKTLDEALSVLKEIINE